ncbi:MAG TPA: NAD(P)/FAD-dependent oxidoreductase [Methanothermococcus okinawensis]|uniref:NAD(P)/FAD-dependent oxidoreductase n=1 Tax=Methanothermococcus okinawensis TaxID=155863 RepID=A0A832ZBC4_9EURY|nr:NAD(P)/FAD-dependent oxidoreductase [Methanothermococcus okinawensis]
MDLDNYDVVIVGGGPIGCITGEHIKHHKVLILEEHSAIGVPLQCGGLVSKEGVKELGYPKGVVNKVRGAYIFSKSRCIKVEDRDIRAYVFERKIMDKDIAKRASKNVDFLFKAYGRLAVPPWQQGGGLSEGFLNFNNLLRRERRYSLSVSFMGDNYHLNPKVIVGADGVKSSIGRSAGIDMRREILSGAQLEMVNVDVDSDFVYVFLDRTYSRDFFAWVIPMGKDRVRVGLCDTSNSYEKLIRLIEEHPLVSQMLKGAVPVEFSVGALPMGYGGETVKNNLLLVGDAAGQVKPLSGGGLYYGAKCAKICGRVIEEYLNGDYPLDYLKSYQTLWRREIGREIDFGLKFRAILKRMDNNMLDRLLEFIEKRGLIDYIVREGDMDNPSRVVESIFKKFFSLK